MSAVLGGLGVDGKLMVVGAPPSRSRCSPLLLIGGTPLDHGLALRHVDRLAGHAGLQRADRRAVDERVFPLERAAEAYERMMSGKARFRVVLITGQ